MADDLTHKDLDLITIGGLENCFDRPVLLGLEVLNLGLAFADQP